MATEPRPLAAASARLRKPPGRPRLQPERPHIAIVTSPVRPVTARLVDLTGAAGYLGLSARAVRSLLDSGALRRVRIELPGGKTLKRVLVDTADLDAFIERSKDLPA